MNAIQTKGDRRSTENVAEARSWPHLDTASHEADRQALHVGDPMPFPVWSAHGGILGRRAPLWHPVPNMF